MQPYADIYLLLNYCTCFGRPSRPSSGVHKTVVAGSGTDHTIWEASIPDSMICTRKLARQYDMYQRLQLQFYVLLMTGAMEARNTESNLTVSAYSCIMLHFFNLELRCMELQIKKITENILERLQDSSEEDQTKFNSRLEHDEGEIAQ